jgi:hypothetical protein
MSSLQLQQNRCALCGNNLNLQPGHALQCKNELQWCLLIPMISAEVPLLDRLQAALKTLRRLTLVSSPSQSLDQLFACACVRDRA